MENRTNALHFSLSPHLYVCIHTDPPHMLQATMSYTIHWAPFKWKYLAFCRDRVGISRSRPSSSEHANFSQGLATEPELLALMTASGSRNPRAAPRAAAEDPSCQPEGRPGTHLLEHTVQGLRAADVKADEHGVRVWVGQGTDVIIIC